MRNQNHVFFSKGYSVKEDFQLLSDTFVSLKFSLSCGFKVQIILVGIIVDGFLGSSKVVTTWNWGGYASSSRGETIIDAEAHSELWCC